MKKMTTLSLTLLATVLLAGCGSDEPAGMPPSITMVSWTHNNCTVGTASDVNITVVATDPDNAANELSYSGAVSGCTGTIIGASATVSCPQLAPYTGSVTVADPDGNSDLQGVNISPCIDGSAP